MSCVTPVNARAAVAAEACWESNLQFLGAKWEGARCRARNFMSRCLQMFFISCRHETRTKRRKSAGPQPSEVGRNSESPPIGISPALFTAARLPADVNRGHGSELEQHLQFPVGGETPPIIAGNAAVKLASLLRKEAELLFFVISHTC